MDSSEEKKPLKSEKSSSTAQQDQTTTQPNLANIHVYPDWAAMQAYYGPRVAVPPYYHPVMASGHAPHPYIWGSPQPMMPPYGPPYAAIYSPGGVYAHPGVPLGAQTHGVPSPAAPVTSFAVEAPANSQGNADLGLMKKLKGFDGLAMSIGHGSTEIPDGRDDNGLSRSAETDTTTAESDGNTTEGNKTRRKRTREEKPTTGKDGKAEVAASSVSSEMLLGTASVSTGVVAKSAGAVASPGVPRVLDLGNASVSSQQACPLLPSEAWLQKERELKRERRKQSNRESARRSRLRKQAETEELAKKVDSLTAENASFRSEISRLTKNSETLKQENALLLEKLKHEKSQRKDEIASDGTEAKRPKPISTENLLSRVNNAGSLDRSADAEGEVFKKIPNSGTKLHQLLDTSPRADAVAAG